MTSWTMPRSALRIVALLLLLAFAASFALGVMGQLNRSGRAPGESLLGSVAGGEPEPAQEAVPLSQERIEGAPPPPEANATKEAKEEAAANEAEPEAPAANTTPVGNAVLIQPPPEAPPPGNAANTEAPPPEEPPH
jgi:hypothetical protein